MRHTIIIEGYTINIHIKSCPRCESQKAVMMGKHSIMCIDCLKNKPYSERHLPSVLEEYTSKIIITRLEKGKIQELNITRTTYSNKVWPKIIPKELEIKADQDRS